MHHGTSGPSWIPFEDTCRSDGQKGATMRLNSAASCASKVMAEDEAG